MVSSCFLPLVWLAVVACLATFISPWRRRRMQLEAPLGFGRNTKEIGLAGDVGIFEGDCD